MSEEQKQTRRTGLNSHTYQTITMNGTQIGTRYDASTHHLETTGNQGRIPMTVSNLIGARRVIPGESQHQIKLIAGNSAHKIEWQDYEDKLLVSGDTDYVALKNMKSAMLQLIDEFKTRGDLKLDGEYKQSFQKRLILLQHQFQGLMRRVLNLKFMHPSQPVRNIDYNRFISQKDNIITELQRKLVHLEDRNRPYEQQILQLKVQVDSLQKELAYKNSYIQDLSRELQNNLANNKTIGRYQDIKLHLASLEKQIQTLKTKNTNMEGLEVMIQGWISGLPRGSNLQRKLEAGSLRIKEDQLYTSMLEKIKYAQELFSSEIAQIQKRNPGFVLPAKSKILQILGGNNTRVSKVHATGVIEIQKETRIQREVAVQDARTKALITGLGRFVKKMLGKYPRLKSELDVQIQEYLSEDLLDVIVNDDLDKIVSITKYVPQMVRVENVYTYSSAKDKKIQFYLRVLIKALLEEFEKVKAKAGIDLDIDEGVIGMIRAELVDLVDIDAILTLFRSIPKVVEVPKYVQKVVDSIVTIPERFIVKQKTAAIQEFKKTEVVHDKYSVPIRQEFPVNLIQQVPVNLIEHVQKPMIYTQYRDVPVNQVIEKSKAVNVPTKVEVVRQQDRPVNVPGEDKIIIERELEIVEVPRTDVRYVETVKEVLQPVEYMVDKIVERVIERQRPVAVPVLQEKLVKEQVHTVVPEAYPVYVPKLEIVKETHEKVVELIQTKQKIVTEDRIIEKIVPVERIIERQPQKIHVKEQVMAVRQVPKVIEVPRTQYVPVKEEVPKQIIKNVERPLFVEVVKVEKQINNVPFINEIVKEIHIPVSVSKPEIIKKEYAVQVPTTVPHYIKEERPVFIQKQETIPVPFYYDRIKPQVQTIEKIVQKIVEVPRTEIIEKIVEKIVVVPRIVEKIVEVPQIIEKIVEKIVEVPKELPPIERIVEKPCVVEVPVEIQVERIVYLTVQKQRIVTEEVLVKDLQTKTIVKPEEIRNERIVVQKQEVPVEVFKDRIEYLHVEDMKVVDNDRVVVHPVQVPVPITLQKELPVYITNEVTHVIPVPQVVQKVIPQIQQIVRVQKVDVHHNIPYIQTEIKEVVRDKVVINTEAYPVEIIQEKIVEVVHQIQKIKEVPKFIEQLIALNEEKPKVYEFNNDYKLIPTPPKVEIIEKVKPYIVNVNKYIERIVEKLVEVPYLIKQTNVQDLQVERAVLGPERYTKETEVVQLTAEKELLREVEKQVIDTVHRIDEVLRVATEVIEKDRDPVIITKDRIIQVPYVLEKIVEKITMMPQIVEVLKHVYEIAQEDQLNVLVDLDVEVKQYTEMAGVLQTNMAPFLEDLRKVKGSQPQLGTTINNIERYLAEFRRYIKHPKILERIREVKQEPQTKVVAVPRQKTAQEAKEQLSRVLLIEQLLGALRKIGADNRNIKLDNYLQAQVMAMFDVSFVGTVSAVNQSFNSQLKKFQNSIESKFSKLDGWGVDHNQMLKSFIDERFQLANVIKRTKQVNQQLTKENNELREKLEHERDMPLKIIHLLIEYNEFMPRMLAVIDKEKNRELYESYMALLKKFQNFKKLYDSIIRQSNFAITFELGQSFMEQYRDSSMRELITEIFLLRDKLKTNNWRENEHAACEATIQRLKMQITRLNSLLREVRVSGIYDERQVTSPKKSSNTHITPKNRRPEENHNIGSQSDVEAYGANYGDYLDSDPNGAGMINSRKYFQTYGSSVEGNRELANSVATYKSSQVINSSQNIRIEGNAGKMSVGTVEREGSSEMGGYGQSGSSKRYTLSGEQRYGAGGMEYRNGGGVQYRNGVERRYVSPGQGSTYSNNVQITTSRVTLDGGQMTSGQMSIRQPEATYTTREGTTSTGTRRYQFHQKKYEQTRE